MNAEAEALPDWEHYRLQELEEALEGLDRNRYPDRARQLERLIKDRREDPQPVQVAEPEFFESAPDWQHYSLPELAEALQGLDRQRYPERARTIQALIDSRKSSRRRATTQSTAQAVEHATKAAPEQAISREELPLLPWDISLGRLGCYLAALIIVALGIAGLAVEPLGIALSLKTQTGQPVGTLLLVLMGLLLAYWPHRKGRS